MTSKYYENPYVFELLNVIIGFCIDYSDASKALEKNPDDYWGTSIKENCHAFADWLCETTGLDHAGVGEVIEKMMEEDDDEME